MFKAYTSPSLICHFWDMLCEWGRQSRDNHRFVIFSLFSCLLFCLFVIVRVLVVGWLLGWFVGWNLVSLCGSSWPGICYVDQVSLELTEILLCWDQNRVPPHLSSFIVLERLILETWMCLTLFSQQDLSAHCLSARSPFQLTLWRPSSAPIVRNAEGTREVGTTRGRLKEDTRNNNRWK